MTKLLPAKTPLLIRIDLTNRSISFSLGTAAVAIAVVFYCYEFK